MKRKKCKCNLFEYGWLFYVYMTIILVVVVICLFKDKIPLSIQDISGIATIIMIGFVALQLIIANEQKRISSKEQYIYRIDRTLEKFNQKANYYDQDVQHYKKKANDSNIKRDGKEYEWNEWKEKSLGHYYIYIYSTYIIKDLLLYIEKNNKLDKRDYEYLDEIIETTRENDLIFGVNKFYEEKCDEIMKDSNIFKIDKEIKDKMEQLSRPFNRHYYSPKPDDNESDIWDELEEEEKLD